MKPGVVEHEPNGAPLDRAMTADREEIKFVIEPSRAPALVRALHRELTAHRFRGEGANVLPDAQHFTTTVYFDTPTRALYRAACENPGNHGKLRAREYYDLHSSLAELATSPEQIVRHQPWLFFELKRRAEARTFKHRVRLLKTEIEECFRQCRFDHARLDGSDPAEMADRVALEAFCAEIREPLAPSCVVNYRRLAFQDQLGALRVTLDLNVAYYRPLTVAWQSPGALLRTNLGAPVGGLRGCLLEVKLRGEAPAWLTRALDGAAGRREAFSKFSAASAAVLAAQQGAHAQEVVTP
ncbi:MAG TPA: VTC domain-containing protein [Polyangiales bacterium]